MSGGESLHFLKTGPLFPLFPRLLASLSVCPLLSSVGLGAFSRIQAPPLAFVSDA